jgi:hypothetical protein
LALAFVFPYWDGLKQKWTRFYSGYQRIRSRRPYISTTFQVSHKNAVVLFDKRHRLSFIVLHCICSICKGYEPSANQRQPRAWCERPISEPFPNHVSAGLKEYNGTEGSRPLSAISSTSTTSRKDRWNVSQDNTYLHIGKIVVKCMIECFDRTCAISTFIVQHTHKAICNREG